MSCHRKNDYDGPRRTRWWRSSERGRSTRKAELTPWSRYVSNCILTAEQISFATPIFTREPAEHMIFRQIKYRCVSVDGMEKIFPRNSTAKWWNRVSLCTKGQVFFSKCARVFCSRLRSYFGSRATQRGKQYITLSVLAGRSWRVVCVLYDFPELLDNKFGHGTTVVNPRC